MPSPTSRRGLWAGRALSLVAVAFLLFDGIIKFFPVPAVQESFAQLGYPAHLAAPIGILELVCVALYVLPSTSILGAIVLTGYLGGAVATHVRVGNPLFGNVLFPTYVGALVWGGLYLRNERVQSLFRFTRSRLQ